VPPLHTLLSRLVANPTDPTNLPPLATKDLITEATAIKISIQAARAAVAALPDVERSIEEQEADIRELEAVIQRQKAVLRKVVNGWAKGI
jgi:hypothetical protein